MDAHQLRRYSRQLPVLGLTGQQLLLNARILIVGMGGLGCPALQYLVAAGVGHIDVVDGDQVELSNLHRQIIFTEADIGQNKAQVAVKRLLTHNSDCTLTALPYYLNETNVQPLVYSAQLVIDATDNYQTRYLLNRCCHQYKIPLISASIYQFDAQLSVFNYQQGPCYECLYSAPPPDSLIPNCAESGVLGVVPGILGGLQATEALKIITGMNGVLSGTLLTINVLTQQYRAFPVNKSHTCETTHGKKPPSSTATPTPDVVGITALELAQKLRQQTDNYFLLDVRQPFERDIISIGGTLIPLAELEQRLSEIPRDKIIVVYCKLGARSVKAASRLMQLGFSQVLTLSGGILQWAKDIDQKIIDY